MEVERELTIGDVVRLKCGGPKMVVSHEPRGDYGDGYGRLDAEGRPPLREMVYCVWFNTYNQLIYNLIPPEILEKVID